MRRPLGSAVSLRRGSFRGRAGGPGFTKAIEIDLRVTVIRMSLTIVLIILVKIIYQTINSTNTPRVRLTAEICSVNLK